VFDYLADLGNHWRIARRFVDVVDLDGPAPRAPADTGTIRLRGPLGVRRTARIKMTAARAPRLMIGTAEIGSRTRARVSWTLARRLHDTRVRLSAEVDDAGALDRAMLALGGRRWLERRFAETLSALAHELAPAGGDAAQEDDRSVVDVS